MKSPSSASPLQSKGWASVKSKHGANAIWSEGANPHWISIKSAPLIGKFGYVPHFWAEPHKLRSAEQAVMQKADENGLSFVLIDPFMTTEPYQIQKPLTTLSGLEAIQIRQHLFLTLGKCQEELMANMRKKHRRDLKKLLANEAVSGETGSGPEFADRFIQVMGRATTRDSYQHYPDTYFSDILSTESQDFKSFATIISSDGKDVAANLVITNKDYAFVLFSGSTEEGRKLASGLMLTWTAALRAKENGQSYYFQWGSAPLVGVDFDPSHKLYGISKFKKGFGSDYIELAEQRAIIRSSLKFRTFLLANKLRRLR